MNLIFFSIKASLEILISLDSVVNIVFTSETDYFIQENRRIFPIRQTENLLLEMKVFLGG